MSCLFFPTWRSQRSGDLWKFGRHRLIGGDARDPETIANLFEDATADLVLTDPPYNVRIHDHAGRRGKTQYQEFAFASGEIMKFAMDILTSPEYAEREHLAGDKLAEDNQAFLEETLTEIEKCSREKVPEVAPSDANPSTEAKPTEAALDISPHSGEEATPRHRIRQRNPTLNVKTRIKLMKQRTKTLRVSITRARQGKIKCLIISMPPRSGKSLAADFHYDDRTVIDSERYQRLFIQTRVSSRKHTEQEVRFARHGMRFAASVGGSLTGQGADIIIVSQRLHMDDLVGHVGG